MSALTTRGRVATAAAMSVVLAVSLAGCFLLPDRPNSNVPDEPTTDDGAFSEYFEQELEWDDCNSGLQCADMSVPIDWTDEDSESVTIALAKVEADDAQGTIFVNPGGPGGSGVDFVEFAVTDDLADSFDVIGWDPRGVGASTRVECFTDDEDKDDALYGTFDDAYFTEGWIDELEEEAAEYADACAENTGALLGKLDTVSTAHDLELMRALVNGDEPLDYVGYSYGTFIGATYAELFPENVGKFVLDGAVDPTLNAFDTLLVQMEGFENGFRAFMQECPDGASGDACPFTGTLESKLTQADELIATVDGLGLESSDGRLLDSATVGTGIAMALYSEDSWPYLTDLFVGLADGDAEPAFFLADIYNDRGDGGSYASNSNDVYVTTTCVDNDFAADTESTIDRLDEIEEAAPTIGRYIALDDFALLDVACSNWPFEPAEAPSSYDAEGAAPILVIGTSNDPATPYSWAVSLSKQLESGVLISVEGEGHTAYNGSNRCVDEVVDNFFLEGTVPDDDPEC